MDGIDVYCATCGHHESAHRDWVTDQPTTCQEPIPCTATWTFCTCPAFVPIRAALAPVAVP